MNNNKKKIMILGLVFALAMSALFVSGCTKQEEATSVDVVLPVMPLSYWTAFYTAENQGFYDDEGLEVTFTYISEGGFGVIKQIGAENGDFGFAGGDSLLVARSKDIPVVMVYQDGKITEWSLLAKKDSGINDLSDLEGKTIAIQGPGNPLHLATEAMLANEGVDDTNITYSPVGGTGMIPALLSGNADAITSNSFYPLIVESQGVEYNIWYAKDYGVDFVGMGILVSENTLINKPDLVEKFVRATKKGEEYAITHKEEAINDYINNFNPDGKKELELKLWQNYLDNVVQPEIYPLGEFRPAQWVSTQDTLYGLGAMEKKVEVTSAYTEEILDKI